MVPTHHHLGVVNQVEGEDEGSRSSVHHLHVLGIGDEDHHDAEDHEPAEEAHQDSAHGREVPLGLVYWTVIYIFKRILEPGKRRW